MCATHIGCIEGLQCLQDWAEAALVGWTGQVFECSSCGQTPSRAATGRQTTYSRVFN